MKAAALASASTSCSRTPDHCCYQGNRGGIETLMWLRLRTDIAPQLLAALGTDDVALHVRNTDCRTDIETYFPTLPHKVAGLRLLV